MKKSLAALLLAACSAAAADHQVVLLWPNGAPGSEGKTGDEATRVTPQGDHVISTVHRPSITVYLPAQGTATGAAVIIAPGGGHSELWVDHEGYNPAQFLSERGVAAFVLKYRLAREKGSTYTIEGNALADAQRAIRVVRSQASEWGINPARVGIIGFSAGGEVAALAAWKSAPADAAAADPIDRADDKPDFQGLIYPAIPKNMTFSKETPPAFLACGENDRQNISQGLPELYLEMKKAGASAELHVYAGTGHGFGVRESNHGPSAAWIGSFYTWLGTRGLLKP